jgi:CDP-glucose 4,6-dehydratase
LQVEASELHEAGLLRLDSSRARQQLAWRPRWSLAQCLEHTLSWHLAWKAGQDMRAFTRQQLAAYTEAS